MQLVNLEQRSNKWLRWRSEGLGSSDAAAVLGVSPWTTRSRLLSEKVAALRGRNVTSTSNSAMARGRRLEPAVAAWYADWYWPTVAVCAEHDRFPFLRASFDGWSRDKAVALEIKAPNRNDHQQALDGEVPDKYRPQVNHLLLVGGIQHCKLLHYVSYSNYFREGEQYAVVAVEPDKRALDELLEAERAFWGEVVAAAEAELDGESTDY